jgi:hypothetical protein
MRSIQAVVGFGWMSVVTLTAAPTFPDEPQKKEPPSKLQARLVAKKDTYKLDLQGKTAEEFRELIVANIKDPFKPLPPAPKIDVILILHNPTDKDIKLIIEPGDEFPGPGMSLELKGPGAFAVSSPPSPLKFFESGYALTIPAGKTVERGVLMNWGIKRQFHYAYWLKPGDYTLSVRSASEGFEGFVTEPIKLKVIDK